MENFSHRAGNDFHREVNNHDNTRLSNINLFRRGRNRHSYEQRRQLNFILKCIVQQQIHEARQLAGDEEALTILQQQAQKQQIDVNQLQECVQKVHGVTKSIDDELENIVHGICNVQRHLELIERKPK